MEGISEPVFAERTLHAEKDPSMVIQARIYAPRNVPESEASHFFPWLCRHELAGAPGLAFFRNKTTFEAVGLDSMGAPRPRWPQGDAETMRVL